MASEIVNQICQALQRYCDGKIDLHEFEDFFVPVLWDIDKYSDDVATKLAGRIHILMAEYSRGDRTLDSMRKELECSISPFVSRIAQQIESGDIVSHWRDRRESGITEEVKLMRLRIDGNERPAADIAPTISGFSTKPVKIPKPPQATYRIIELRLREAVA